MGDVGIGAVLQEARVEQGRGLDEAAAATAMRATQVEALESDRFEVFGGDVYAKGFIKNYATWLGLDAAPLLDRYRRYVEHGSGGADARKIASSGSIAGNDPSDLPLWLVRVVAVLGVAALAVGLVQFVSARVPAPAEEPSVADAPDPVEPAPSPSDEATEAPAPEPAPAPTIDGVQLTLLFDAPSWISVTIDGEPSREGTFQSGEVLDVEGTDEVVVRFGNAGGVSGLLNGDTVGPFGDPGAVVELRFTEGGIEQV